MNFRMIYFSNIRSRGAIKRYTGIDDIFIKKFGHFEKRTKKLQYFALKCNNTIQMLLMMTVINPNPTGGGPYKPTSVSKNYSSGTKVGLTSDQAVNSSLSVVLRSKIFFDQFGP